MENKSLSTHTSGLFADIKEFIELKYCYGRLDAIEKFTTIASLLTSLLVLFFFVIGILLFLSLGLGFFFGSLLHNNFLGFLVMAGIYLLFAIILFVFRKALIIRPVQNNLLKTLFKNENDFE